MWYLLAEQGKTDEDTDTPDQVGERVNRGVEISTKLINRLSKKLGPNRRIVSIINANAPQIDAYIARETNKNSLERNGGVKNAQGFKLDFNGPNKEDVVFGEWPQ